MSQINEQTADYQLVALSPVLKAANSRNTLLESLPVWLSAQTRKSAGRGRSASNTSQYGVQKLRELILELAVRGKLVPQDSNDEPASILLEKIAEEKALLVKAGKIKKQKKLPKISNEEKSFSIPAGWRWARLQDISSYIQRGKGPKYSEVGRVRVISQKCVQNSGFDITPAKFVDDTTLDNYQSERFLMSNDLLWNSTGTGTVGRVNLLENIVPNTLVADSHVTVIRPLLVSSQFISSFISAPGVQVRIAPEHENSLVSGSTKQVELNTSQVTSIALPVPPLAEQHHIVKKVDELMALCDQLEQQQADAVQAHDTLVKVLLDTLTLSENAEDFQQNWRRIAEHFDTLFTTESSIDKLKQTLLQLAVMGKLVPQDPNDEPASVLLEKIAEEKAHLVKQGKIKKQKSLGQLTLEEHPFKLPSGWMWVHWNEILANDDAPFKRGPFGSALKKDMFVSSGYKVYEQYCPINDDCSYERYFITEEKFKSMKGFSVREDDYLVSCSGVTLGRITQVPKDFKEGIINQALLRVRINHKYVDKNFFKLLFRSPYFQKLIFDNSTGSAIPNVKGVKELKIMPVPLLPLVEQREIVAKFEELMAMCDQLKDRLNQAQTLQQQLADTVVSTSVYDDCH